MILLLYAFLGVLASVLFMGVILFIIWMGAVVLDQKPVLRFLFLFVVVVLSVWVFLELAFGSLVS